ncbi:putative ammonium transporter 3 [Lutzomyia longipalpis]|uniref:putative ammonium transporter 3 n=1 Tax=Lutzomyia longipalpis TaxID=7200 RepID=UPI00248469BE|nr:putative ammonium transporter 3 [Lutzomyia longipalpis]
MENLTGNGLKFSFARNSSYVIPGVYDLSVEDTNWVLTSSFIIFTMQTGFGMLESGCVSVKNEVNIMMKNVIDIVLGGFTYWLFGYGMSFGRGPLTNPFIAIGDFLIDPSVGDPLMGPIFAAFLFQLSFSTTATTIVSGAMAERCNFKAYCIFSFLNTAVYCIPAGWVWGEHGFLNNLGCVDIAGSGPVHLIGGSAAFASAVMLGPRMGRYEDGIAPLPLGNPVNACMGLFVLWWGWLAFNSGSTYGVSGTKWQYAARAAVITMMGSFGGGTFSVLFSMFKNDGRMDVVDLINGILGALVSITAGCFLYHAWEAIIIGVIGSILTCVTMPLFDKMAVDDPVGASSVHGVSGIWGVIAVGLFADNPIPLTTTNGRSGLFKGGGWYLLGVQCLAALCLCVWGVLSTFLLLWVINKIVPIRMEVNEELLGADLMEHHVRHGQIGISRALSALAPLRSQLTEEKDVARIGMNPGHDRYIETLKLAEMKLQSWRDYGEEKVREASAKKSSHRRFSNLARAVPIFRRKTRTEGEISTSDAPRGTFSVSQQVGESSGKDNPNFAWVD